MNNIIYHIVFYIVAFFIIRLVLRKYDIIVLTLLVSLPVLGEVLQIPLREYFWFVFELEDIYTNFMGASIGILIAAVCIDTKGGGRNEDHGSVKEASQ